MVIPTVHFRSEYSEIPLRIAKGHFATSHSHINYFIDMTYTKHRLAEARQAARELAVKFQSSKVVDTILCLDGTEVLGACLAEELIEEGYVRELISKVQTMRKEADFEVTDKIELSVSCGEKLLASLDKHSDEICAATLSSLLRFGEPEGVVKEWDLNGENVVIGIKR